MRECVPAYGEPLGAGRTGRATNAAAHAQPPFSTPPGPLGEGGPFLGGKGDFSFRGALGVVVCSPKKELVGKRGVGGRVKLRALDQYGKQMLFFEEFKQENISAASVSLIFRRKQSIWRKLRKQWY